MMVGFENELLVVKNKTNMCEVWINYAIAKLSPQ